MQRFRPHRFVLLSTLCLTLLLATASNVSASSLKSSEMAFRPLSCRQISSFIPTSGSVGSSVTIAGCGFAGATSVTFNGVSATFKVDSQIRITATVPTGATTGMIAVTTPGGTVKSSKKFVVLPAITLTLLAGPPTSSVSVSGTNFGRSEAVDIYFDTADEALAATNGQGQFSGISIQVPAGAVPGTHWVTAIGRHSGLSAQTSFLVQTDWAQYRNIPKHTGTNPYENVLSPTNVANLDVDWSAPTGAAVASSPAVVNGVVYVGSGDDHLYAFNAQTGAQLWSATTAGGVSSSPAVANGVVYVGSTFDDHLYAFNAQTGAQLWSATTGSLVSSSPAVANGVVYVGSDDDHLYAYALPPGDRLKPPARSNAATLRPDLRLRIRP